MQNGPPLEANVPFYVDGEVLGHFVTGTEVCRFAGRDLAWMGSCARGNVPRVPDDTRSRRPRGMG